MKKVEFSEIGQFRAVLQITLQSSKTKKWLRPSIVQERRVGSVLRKVSILVLTIFLEAEKTGSYETNTSEDYRQMR